MQQNTPKILIISSDTGGGHRSAAQTLSDGLHKFWQGESVAVRLELDKQEVTPSAELMDCLQDEPLALQHFKGLPKSHQNYFTRWIESAKTETTKAKRIAQAINGLSKGAQFGEVIREIKRQKEAMS